MKLAIALLAYAGAIAAIYGAFHLAPDMKWPVNDVEFMAANLLVIGMAAKSFGHAMLLSWGR